MDTPKHRSTPYQEHQNDSKSRPYATILTVDPVRVTASVIDSSNRVLNDVMIVRDAGPDGEGDFGLPAPGWKALLTDRFGVEAIERCFPPHSYFDQGRPPENDDYSKSLNTWLSITGAGEPYRVVEHKARNFRSNRPHDLLAGDQGLRSSEGASLFALRGGVAGMKVSDLCQFMLNQVDDLARLVARNVDVFTDGGHIQISNDEGATKLSLKFNSDAKNTYEDQFEFDLTLGSGLDSFIQWELRTADTKDPVASFKLDQNGIRHQWLKGDDLLEVNGSQGVGITKDQKVIIGGLQSVEVDQSTTHRSETFHKLISPKVYLGNSTPVEPVPMGDQLTDYLRQLVFWLNNQAVWQTPFGPTIPGATLIKAPAVPDFLSKVVYLIQHPNMS